MAVALLTYFFYWALLSANLVFLPLAGKLGILFQSGNDRNGDD